MYYIVLTFYPSLSLLGYFPTGVVSNSEKARKRVQRGRDAPGVTWSINSLLMALSVKFPRHDMV